MDLPPTWSQTCVCGRAFSVPQAYTFHQRSCQRTKKRLSGALEKVKDILQARKRRKVESVLLAQNLANGAGPSDLAHPNEISTPVVHSEVRFAFNRVPNHLLTYSLYQGAMAIAKDYEDVAQNPATEAGASSQPVDLAHPNDLPIPVVHPEVRFPFNRVHHLLIYSLF